MPERTGADARFRPLGRRRIDTCFEGGNVTSDGGVLFVREIDEKFDLSRRIAECLTDPRRQASCEHTCRNLVRQRIVALALGYEDLNDHDTLRDDQLIQTAVGRDRRLACRTTLGRFERRVVDEEVARRLQDLLVDLFIEEHAEPPDRVVLDFDATDDVVHGHQEGRAFNKFYDAYIFLPLYVFCGPHPLVAWLRPGSDGAAEGVEEWLRWLTERLRAAWPDVEIVFRGDSGFAKPAIYRCCEALGVEYIIGISKNPVLLRKSKTWMEEAETAAAEAEDGKARVFGMGHYGFAEKRERVRRQHGVTLISPPSKSAPPTVGDRLTKRDFAIDFDADTATCPAGVVAADKVWRKLGDRQAPAFAWPRDACDVCPLRTRCLTGRSRSKRLLLHPHERALQESREMWKQAATKRKYRRRGEFERLVGRMTRLGGRHARAWGIAFARFQVHCIAAINNLGLLAARLAQGVPAQA